MRVAILSDQEAAGGAAVAASRLSLGLTAIGVEVIRLVAHPDSAPHPWRTEEMPGRSLPEPFAFFRQIGGGRMGLHFLSRSTESYLAHLLDTIRPDVINVHNLHGALGWRPDLIRICALHAPTVWTLHDMWSFTGRCAYNYDCQKFLQGCDFSCPTPNEYPALAPGQIQGAWEQRKHLLVENTSLVAVSPSRWLATQARAGLWSGHRVEVIPYGLSLESYSPVDRQLARTALRIAAVGPVVLVVAERLADPRKGGQLFVEALAHTRHLPLTVVTLGSGDLGLVPDGVHVQSLGYIDDQRTLALAYNAADVLVHPATADNLPNVVLEAIACGTPVISFATGGLPEIVRPHLTGWLAAEVSAASLAQTVDAALSELAECSDLRTSCRAVAVADYRLSLQAERYLELFNSLGPASSTGASSPAADEWATLT